MLMIQPPNIILKEKPVPEVENHLPKDKNLSIRFYSDSESCAT